MKLKQNNVIFGILLLIYCTNRFWGVNLPWYINPIIAVIGIVLLFARDKFKITVYKHIHQTVMLSIIPQLAIIVYSISLWLMQGMPSPSIVRNLFTSNLWIILSVLFSATVFIIFQKKSIDFFLKCATLSYLIGSVLYIIIRFGVIDSLKYLLTSVTSQTQMIYGMEVNDLTFSVGYLFLYYLMFSNEDKKKKRIKCLTCFLLIFWGLKRIEIAAIIVCYSFYLFLLRKKYTSKLKGIVTIGILGVSYFYLWIIHSGVITNLAKEYNINFMGRLGTYSYIADTYSSFDPLFWGHGAGYIDEIINELSISGFKIGYAPIISLHSDTLRMYIGLGFFGFGIWIIYHLFIRSSIMKKWFSERSINAYLIYSLYTFILYLTDNTYSYAVTRFVFTLVILCSYESKYDYIKCQNESLQRGERNI